VDGEICVRVFYGLYSASKVIG